MNRFLSRLAFVVALSFLWQTNADAQRRERTTDSVPRHESLEVARKSDEPYNVYVARVQRAREARDFRLRSGTLHFAEFDDFVDRAAYQTSPQKQIYITTGIGVQGGMILVQISRVDSRGQLQVKQGFVQPDSFAAEAYARVFGGENATPTTLAQLKVEFSESPVLVDDSIFFLRQEGMPLDSIRPRPLPVLKFAPDHRGLTMRTSGLDLYASSKNNVYELQSFQMGRASEVLLPRIGDPAVYAFPPPGRDRAHLAQLETMPFKTTDLSAMLLEGNTDAKRVFIEGQRRGAFSKAADFTESTISDASLRARIESEFQLRSGKVVAIVGHYEQSNDKVFVRHGDTKVASITRAEILQLAKSHNVDILLLGCNTASVDGQGNPFGAMLKSVNSERVVRSLINSSVKAGNWRDFVAGLSASDAPVMFASALRRSEAGEGEWRSAELHNRLADGRSLLLARVFYYLRCSALGRC